MPLTNRQRKAKALAELEALIANLMSARRRDDQAATTEAREALINYNSPFLDLNREAEDAAEAAILVNLHHALDELAEITARLGSFGDVLKTAREVARHGTKELLIPRLAASAAQALELFTVLRQAADTISEQLDAAEEANDLADVQSALHNVLTELNSLRAASRDASTG
ncbi:MAG: hypothetical protein OXK82_03110 [Deltaproteobacteria bacterium]|nr:hypothetical protein [Deltaproteobacteria bacterium]